MEFLPQWLRPAKRRPEEQAEDADEDPTDAALNGVEVKIEVNGGEVGDSTPKAKATEPSGGGNVVPSFSLDEVQERDKGKDDKATASPTATAITASSPTTKPPQNSSPMPPPPPPSQPSRPSSQRSATSLMPPPSRPPPTPRSSTAASLRVPSSGPLPSRGPPANSQQRLTTTTTTTTPSTPNSRGKVLLSPGHSPMDWAALTKKENLSGVATFQRITPSHLKQMTGRKGKPAWSSWQGKVYNITPYLPFHPGGEGELMKAAGRDGTKLFMEVHPWVNWENMLSSCMVGVMVPEGHESSPLEEMD